MNINELLLKMADIVKSKMKNYLTDFFVYDTDTIAEIMNHNNYHISRVDLVWIVRENGTHIFDSADVDAIKKVIYQYGKEIKGYYRLVKPAVGFSWKFVEISKEDAIKGIRYADAKKSIYWNDAVCVVIVHPDGHTEEIKKTGGYSGDSVLYNDYVVDYEYDKTDKTYRVFLDKEGH